MRSPAGAAARAGMPFDLYAPALQVQGLLLEDLQVLTLVINAEDDSLSAVGNAWRAVERMLRGKLMAIRAGAHLVLGAEDRIRDRIRHHIATT